MGLRREGYVREMVEWVGEREGGVREGGVGLEEGEGVGLEGAESEEGRRCTTKIAKIELKVWDQ